MVWQGGIDSRRNARKVPQIGTMSCIIAVSCGIIKMVLYRLFRVVSTGSYTGADFQLFLTIKNDNRLEPQGLGRKGKQGISMPFGWVPKGFFVCIKTVASAVQQSVEPFPDRLA